MSEKTIVRYEAVLEYDPEEANELTEQIMRENMLDLIAREPRFGTIAVETEAYGDD